jgi:hypothetical protein
MKRMIPLAALLVSCNIFPSAPAPEPVLRVRVDTVTVKQTVEPPLPEGQPAELCLSNGITAQVHIAANGDTLIGEKRIAIKDLRPAVAFAGGYAQNADWYRRGDVVKFDRRDYQRAGVERARACDEMKLVGDYLGVPIFAEVTAPQILPMLIIPVRPGTYQDYLRVRR